MCEADEHHRERALLLGLRRWLLPPSVRRPAQLAAVLLGSALPPPAGPDERTALGLPNKGAQDPQPEPASAVSARLDATPLRCGTLLVARTTAGDDSKRPDAHCEAMLCTRLARGDASTGGGSGGGGGGGGDGGGGAMECSGDGLAGVSQLAFYSYLCPCPTCSEKLARFAAARPALRVSLAYERDYIPAQFAVHREGVSDASSVAALRTAGVGVYRLVGRTAEDMDVVEA
eukprot:Transcript_17798.p1 GENE.Transcript_17798~~Transcript_17798.p1  ORF type:complete len:231 (-),score=54.09 Transcript_17798:35-727(-)